MGQPDTAAIRQPEPAPTHPHHDPELRLYGLNAVRAVFARRPQAIRKLYLLEARIPQLQPLLKWCVANRIGYRVVEETDLQKLAASTHHEGVVADVLREEPQSLTAWLRTLPDGPQCALWLDGVGNPHNLGAILRSAAHFGVAAVLLPKHSPLLLSGAAARVAEGGAEHVPFVRLGREDNAIAQLHGAGFILAATVARGGSDVFRQRLPQRLVYVIGAEGEGMDPNSWPHATAVSRSRKRRGRKPERRGGHRRAAGPVDQHAVTIAERFDSQEDWRQYRLAHESTLRRRRRPMRCCCQSLTVEGVRGNACCATNHAGSVRLAYRHASAVSLRESLACETCNANARQRATAQVLFDSTQVARADVYITEQASNVYLQLKRHCRRLVGSEFVHGWRQRCAVLWLLRKRCLQWLRSEDVTALSFGDGAFDAVVSLDVLEHVPDHRRALAEFRRVLRPGGVLVFTVPFYDEQAGSTVLARVGADGVEHLLPPEYHGDPVSSGALCFHHFGWDLLEAMRAAGFSTAEALRVRDAARGIPQAQWILRATR
jgi:TrmH RNA methyltransferase